MYRLNIFFPSPQLLHLYYFAIHQQLQSPERSKVFIFFRKHTDPPIVGAPDIGQISLSPKSQLDLKIIRTLRSRIFTKTKIWWHFASTTSAQQSCVSPHFAGRNWPRSMDPKIQIFCEEHGFMSLATNLLVAWLKCILLALQNLNLNS